MTDRGVGGGHRVARMSRHNCPGGSDVWNSVKSRESAILDSRAWRHPHLGGSKIPADKRLGDERYEALRRFLNGPMETKQRGAPVISLGVRVPGEAGSAPRFCAQGLVKGAGPLYRLLVSVEL